MKRARVIPCLLISNGALVKTIKFENPKYIGDPLNAIRIFSEKNVDELVLLDISASRSGVGPNYDLISRVASECFMPLAYGGGITTLDQARRLIRCGVEKIILNSFNYESYSLITEIVKVFGSQAVVGSVDVKKNFLGKQKLFCSSTKKQPKVSLRQHIKNLEEAGVGELLINSVDNDGVMGGYDLCLVKKIVESVRLPVIACGGAGNVDDLVKAIKLAGASGAAAGSLFIFKGKLKAVLINYPSDLIIYEDKD